MNVYRIVRNKHLKEDLQGIGASKFPGRWNKKDMFCVYAAESRALALIEHMANVTKENYISTPFTIRALFIPDACILKVPLTALPKNWRETPPPNETRAFGTALIHNKKAVAYLLPSAIIPQEFNIIIDPAHPDILKIKIVNEQALEFDNRLKQ